MPNACTNQLDNQIYVYTYAMYVSTHTYSCSKNPYKFFNEIIGCCILFWGISYGLLKSSLSGVALRWFQVQSFHVGILTSKE